MHEIHATGIDDVAAFRALCMLGTRTMAALAAHIPFGNGILFDIEAN
jgi:hypothetical protein